MTKANNQTAPISLSTIGVALKDEGVSPSFGLAI